MKYLKSWTEGTRQEPQTSKWTNSNAELLQLLTQLWNEVRWYLPNSHNSQPKVEMEDSTRMTDRSFCKGCLRRQCHRRIGLGWSTTKPVTHCHPDSTSLPLMTRTNPFFSCQVLKNTLGKKECYFTFVLFDELTDGE